MKGKRGLPDEVRDEVGEEVREWIVHFIANSIAHLIERPTRPIAMRGKRSYEAGLLDEGEARLLDEVFD